MELSSQEAILILPIGVVGRVDVGRLRREMEALENYLQQATIRGAELKMPRTSHLLEELIQVNKLNPLDKTARARLLQFLQAVHAQAPLLHISFSADPSPLFVQRLVTYLRQDLHPLVLLQVGLQPNIGAGCVVRTTNKYFDFSLRQHFKAQRPLLIQKIRGSVTAVEKPA